MSEPLSARMVDINALTAFSFDGAQTAVLLGSEGVPARPLCLEPGQGVGPCRMGSTVLYYVIEGHERLRMEDELDASSLVAGALAVAPAGAVRTIVTGERMRVLAVQIHPAQGRNR